ncbi:MAG: DNA polymerase IV [Micavibrio sp.]|nr:DNA polymerase IV [Micavibrio sp.]
MNDSKTRKIIHIDMDAFYAAIEQRDNPELRGKAIAVGGSGGRGVVMTASYEARQYGVRSAMPSVTASRKCPHLIFVKSNREKYKYASDQIRKIFYEYTDLVEPLSLDEAYLDVTENKTGEKYASVIATEIRARIYEVTGLTASAGVSYNKFLAKIASDINKPNGQTIIRPDQADAFLESLPIEKFHGIGKVTAGKMRDMGITDGKSLKSVDLNALVSRFGKAGRHYYHVVRGIDAREVKPDRIRKSVGAEHTFLKDIDSLEGLKDELGKVVERLLERLGKVDRKGYTLTLKLKTSDFQILSRSYTGETALDNRGILTETSDILLDNADIRGRSYRLIGLQISNFRGDTEDDDSEQPRFDFT